MIKKQMMLSLLCKSRFFSPAVFYSTCKNNHINVFVYSSGKSGSASIFESFKDYGKSCMHVHTTNYFLKRILKQELYDGFHLFEYINCINTNKDILIIDSFREPISRKISAFFQHFNRFPFIQKDNLNKEELIAYYSKNIQQLIKLFNENYLLQHENYYGFNEYQKDGLVIENETFDHTKKRMYIRHNNKFFLLLRFDDISLWENIIKDLGYEDFKLITANKTDKKDTSSLYENFKRNYNIPRNLLDKVYNRDNNILKIFYTDDELENHYNKWVQKSI